MKCPYCSSPDSRVINSRASDEGASIRRRRECLSCARRFTTYERAQLEPLMVVKRSGLREAFNPDKLLRGLVLASEKRPVDAAALRVFAYSFEDEVQSGEIPTEEIGRRAMTFLRPLDDVAYIRFASVYRDFDSLERFIEEIRGLKDTEKALSPSAGEQP
ncbi:transcriptional regulator NrdR [Deinococcus sp. VB343]|uniref:Transcriptional repressor NrdR n=1 Tax=Deinococcus sp. VB142 TaxID=3112952 RepID=A0AAU6PZN4_9DEIO|nr:transcriptional regulator NrdR [Deinococcus sp.]MDO4247149.1 transcriptional regulator NrdR [Deinococcus sp.]